MIPYATVRKLEIEPDIIGDFRNIPFDDNTFYMVVFDPPHLLKVGENSWLAKKYGKLSESWPEDFETRLFGVYESVETAWNTDFQME